MLDARRKFLVGLALLLDRNIRVMLMLRTIFILPMMMFGTFLAVFDETTLYLGIV